MLLDLETLRKSRGEMISDDEIIIIIIMFLSSDSASLSEMYMCHNIVMAQYITTQKL